jgi:iron complex transport system substrate-binding protein
MLADPPRVIFATADPRSNESRGLAHPALRSLTGTRYERFPPSLLWCGGPTVIKAAERLAEVRAKLGARPSAGSGRADGSQDPLMLSPSKHMRTAGPAR